MESRNKRNAEKVMLRLVADHPIVLRYLRQLLANQQKLKVLSAVGNSFKGRGLTAARQIVVIDVGRDTFLLAPYLRTLRLRVKDPQILVIGMPLSDEDACHLLSHGVRGIIAYDNLENQILAAINSLHEGRPWVSAQVLERYLELSSSFSVRKNKSNGNLSPREGTIVGLLHRRLSNKQIADALKISERTVRFHLQNIFDKLDVRDRHSVADMAPSIGLSISLLHLKMENSPVKMPIRETSQVQRA